MDDSQIMELYRSGECELAFGELVKAYSERLYWHVRTMVGSHEDADDLMQDIFAKAWTALPTFRGDSRLLTWLWRIANNEAINFCKRARLRNVQSVEDLPPATRKLPSADPYFNGDKAQELLCRAVATLPPRQRSIFSMRWYDEMSYEDISRITRVSVGALKASYHLAKKRVRDFLLSHREDV